VRGSDLDMRTRHASSAVRRAGIAATIRRFSALSWASRFRDSSKPPFRRPTSANTGSDNLVKFEEGGSVNVTGEGRERQETCRNQPVAGQAVPLRAAAIESYLSF
jgi:hypothetical protein